MEIILSKSPDFDQVIAEENEQGLPTAEDEAQLEGEKPPHPPSAEDAGQSS